MKVLLTATVQSHICQFHKPLVEVLHKHGCEVHVAARDNLAEKNGYSVDFSQVTSDEMIRASAEAFACQYDSMNQLFQRITKKVDMN